MKLKKVKEFTWECSDSMNSSAKAEVFELKNTEGQNEIYFRLFWGGNAQSPLIFFANAVPKTHRELKNCVGYTSHFLFE